MESFQTNHDRSPPGNEGQLKSNYWVDNHSRFQRMFREKESISRMETNKCHTLYSGPCPVSERLRHEVYESEVRPGLYCIAKLCLKINSKT